MTWTGWDGSVWELSSPTAPVRMMGGMRGLYKPGRQRWTSTSPARPGSRYRGGRDLERHLFWPVLVHHPAGGQAWFDLDAAFWRTMDADRPGVLEVRQPSGARRSLVCRWDDDGDPAPDIDPAVIGAAFYGINLVAEDPYWRGEPIVRTFVLNPDTVPFIPTGGATPFYISPDLASASATVSNPGTEPVWPTWTARDEHASLSVGVGGAVLGVVPDLVAGDVLVMDTARQTTTLNGVRARGLLSPHDFAPIPAGGSADLVLIGAGPGTVTVELVPLHQKAW